MLDASALEGRDHSLFRMFPGDVLDRDAITALIDRSNPDVIVNVAGYTHVGDSWHLIEALSAGKPVVASVCTSFLELAQSLPIRLADPDDSQQWHEALLYSTLPDVGEVELGPVLTSPQQVRDLIIQESS